MQSGRISQTAARSLPRGGDTESLTPWVCAWTCRGAKRRGERERERTREKEKERKNKEREEEKTREKRHDVDGIQISGGGLGYLNRASDVRLAVADVAGEKIEPTDSGAKAGTALLSN